MSLLNQVLRDLDTRQASELERLRIPAHVKPLPPPAVRRVKHGPIAAAALLTVVLLGAVAWWFAGRNAALEPAPQSATAKPSRIAPDADAVAEALEIQRENARQTNGTLSAVTPQPAVTAEPEPAPQPAQQPIPEPAPKAVAPQSVAAPKAAAPSSPQEASGSIRGMPLAASEDHEGRSKLEITPKAAGSEAETRRAVNMMERGLKAEPEALLRQVLGAEPGYQPARSALFRLFAATGRQEDAAALLTDGLRLNASNTQWAMNLARLQAERDDNAGAWETLQRTLPYARMQADYRAFCGTVLTRLNRPSEAIDHYRAALRAKPDEARWWVGLGLALEADGKAPEARDAFLRAQATGSLPPELATFIDGKLRK